MTEDDPIVFVVDDDTSVRKGLKRLIKSVGLGVETFASAREFMDYEHPDRPGCLVLDVRMPGLSGLDLQEELAAAGHHMPIVFITGHGSITMSVRAMKAGAVNFLEKPFEDQDLLDVIREAIEKDVQARQERRELANIRQRIDTLTPREYEVLRLVITGMLNKQIAAALGASEKTIKVHRSHVMRKMGIVSAAELARLAEKAGITPREL
jgi:FixJ family two-component response regulator